MAGNPKNLEKAPRGSDIIFDAFIRQYPTGPLVDPDFDPNVTIKDPVGAIVNTGTASKVVTTHPNGYYEYTYSIPNDATESSNWIVLWETELFGIPLTNFEYFTVLPAGAIDFDDLIQIATNWLNQIKKAMLFPIIPKVLLDDPEIKEFCVFPALHTYFKKFPIKHVTTQQTDGNTLQVIPFPDDFTYGVMNRKFIKLFVISGSSGTSNFWQLVNYNMKHGFRSEKRYGTEFGFADSAYEVSKTQLQLEQTKLVGRTIEYFNVFPTERVVRAKSSNLASLEITWAKFSYNFADVKYTHQFNVVKLAQAALLMHMADTGNVMEDNDATKRINVEGLKDRAEKLLEEVKEDWGELSDIIMVS
jgi:hypothetical protein